MILSRQTPMQWRAQLTALVSRWVKRALSDPALADTPVSATPLENDFQPKGAAAEVESISAAPVSANGVTARLLAPDRDTHDTMTPLEWFRGLDDHTSVVAFIDHSSCQLMEMVALDSKQIASFFRIPSFADDHAQWLAVGKRRLQRKHFDPATMFAKQESALTALEDLLSARWYASTELADQDQAILRAFEAACPPDGAPLAEIPAAAHAITELHALLKSRQVVSKEIKDIDEALISAFQQIGVALPDSPPPVS